MLAAAFPGLGIGFVGVALAFGLTVLTMAFAIGHIIASGKAGFDVSAGFASNGYGDHSPGGYSLGAAFICELVMTFMFLMIILGATDRPAPAGFAPIIGLG